MTPASSSSTPVHHSPSHIHATRWQRVSSTANRPSTEALADSTQSCRCESSLWVRASLKRANIVLSCRLVIKQDHRMRVLEQRQRIQVGCYRSQSARPETNPPAINGNAHPSARNSISMYKQNHPSFTAAPVVSLPPTRPIIQKKTKSSRNVLDLGGIRLKNIAPALFKYECVASNRNQPPHIPPTIASLHHLTVLDLSCNLPDTLRPELGVCASLEHRWLFE